MKKTDFSKNLSSRICPKVDSDYLRGSCENVVYHFHGTMQTIITSYLRPVLNDFNVAMMILDIRMIKSRLFLFVFVFASTLICIGRLLLNDIQKVNISKNFNVHFVMIVFDPFCNHVINIFRVSCLRNILDLIQSLMQMLKSSWISQNMLNYMSPLLLI